MTPSAHFLPPKTPASRLSDDILFMVFSLNTMQDDYFLNPLHFPQDWLLDQEDALLTARRTSQVCTQWRNVMLSSSSIWARSLHLKHLEQERDEWRNEMLRRIGSPRSYPRAKDFFLDFVAGEYWERVERLHTLVTPFFWTPDSTPPAVDDKIDTKDSFEEELSSDPRWLFLCRPAPSMRIFNFTTCSVLEFQKYFLHKSLLKPNESPQDETNNSPHLRTMILEGLDLNANSSFPNLRSLTIRNAVPTSSFLEALKNLSHLEELDLRHHCAANGYREVKEAGKNVHLPCLKELRFECDDLRTADLLLNSITLAPGCILHLVIDIYYSYKPELVTSFLTTLARYMRNTFSTSNHLAKRPKLQLSATLQTFVAEIILENDLVFSLKFLNDYEEVDDPQSPDPPRIYTPSEEWDTTTGALCQLISTGADVLPASRYQTLSLHVDRVTLQRSFEELSKMVYCASSVEELHGTVTAYHALFDFQRVNKDELEPVFPRLQRAIVEYHPDDAWINPSSQLPGNTLANVLIMDFLKHREDHFGSVRVTRHAQWEAAKEDYFPVGWTSEVYLTWQKLTE
ncbi:hypothetical protein CPC08DRAFT_770898 [Agrocybe pediades]|nr:hypothetical protein CPC08DRAFT_770898 [Agrocybe pediades]